MVGPCQVLEYEDENIDISCSRAFALRAMSPQDKPLFP